MVHMLHSLPDGGGGARRVPGTHSKAQIAHGKPSHGEPYLYSRPNCGHTAKLCRESTLTHGKKRWQTVGDGGGRLDGMVCRVLHMTNLCGELERAHGKHYKEFFWFFLKRGFVVCLHGGTRQTLNLCHVPPCRHTAKCQCLSCARGGHMANPLPRFGTGGLAVWFAVCYGHSTRQTLVFAVCNGPSTRQTPFLGNFFVFCFCNHMYHSTAHINHT